MPVIPPVVNFIPPPPWSHQQRIANTSAPIYSVSTASLAARLTALVGEFQKGKPIEAADINELIDILNIFATHYHQLDDWWWISFGNGNHPYPTIIF